MLFVEVDFEDFYGDSDDDDNVFVDSMMIVVCMKRGIFVIS